MISEQRFSTKTLREVSWGGHVRHILAAALQAVEPAAAVHHYLQCDRDTLVVGSETYDLPRYERVLLFGAGKAGAPMARAVADVLGDWVAEGVVIVKDEASSADPAGQLAASSPAHSRLEICAARHPLPDERGVAATRRIATLLEGATERDLVLILISGGGSALLTLPAPGISLDDMQVLTAALLACGATINEINCLRKHLDLVKGGGLARMAAPATVATLILSDVVGSPLDVIASGPTVPDSTTFADAYAVLQRYHLDTQIPAAVMAQIHAGLRGETPETPKEGDPVFAQVNNLLVGSNPQAAAAALEAARAAGFNALVLTTYLQGEAREAGRVLAAVGRELAASGQPLPRPACLICGGETTVTLRGKGRGGRNQELALAAVQDLAGLPDVALVTLATDGGDGPTDAAGAVVTGETLKRAQAAGLDPDLALDHNDAYPFFAVLDDLLKPGATETNVNDLAFVFAF
jgi:hydroxypyruvate reductase